MPRPRVESIESIDKRVARTLTATKGRTAREIALLLDLPEWRLLHVRKSLRRLLSAGVTRCCTRKGAKGRPAEEYVRA